VKKKRFTEEQIAYALAQESTGQTIAEICRKRGTPVGSWMRRWKIDELPQLLDVLRGDRGIVGRRPQVKWTVQHYIPEERKVLL